MAIAKASQKGCERSCGADCARPAASLRVSQIYETTRSNNLIAVLVNIGLCLIPRNGIILFYLLMGRPDGRDFTGRLNCEVVDGDERLRAS